MKFNYSKLLGKIKECGETQYTLSLKISCSEATLSLKLNGKSFFEQRLIKEICDVLNIPENEIGAYFFCKES